MNANKRFQAVIEIALPGILVTIATWTTFFFAGNLLLIPKIVIFPLFRILFLGVFVADAIYILISSNYYLRKYSSTKKLINEGAYQFIRHPQYSLWIFSFTGILGITLLSWSVFITAIPLSIFWSWLVQREEADLLDKYGIEYQKYIEQTGQFLPSWRAMKVSVERER